MSILNEVYPERLHHWTLSPNVDVMRDGRWGRVGETCGEDPYVVGQIGTEQN